MGVIVGFLIIIVTLLGGADFLVGAFIGWMLVGLLTIVLSLLGWLASFAEIPRDANQWPQELGPSFEKKYWSPFGWRK